jgi:hypothetical protein
MSLPKNQKGKNKMKTNVWRNGLKLREFHAGCVKSTRLAAVASVKSLCFPRKSTMASVVLVLLPVLMFAMPSRAQNATGQTPPPPAAGQSVDPRLSPAVVVSRGANNRVWERTSYEPGPNGQLIPRKHRYTELATGMHYWKDGQWVESKEEIAVQPDGSAAAVQGQHQAYFPADIFNGAIEVVTPDGKHLHSRPVGISYFDGQNSVLLAELTNSTDTFFPGDAIHPEDFAVIPANQD